MFQEYDLAIVGGGPGGMAAALAARNRSSDLRILIIEKRRHPRFKLCGGGVTGRSLSVLSRLGIDLIAADIPRILARGVDIRYGDRNLLIGQDGVAFVFDRPALDAWLAVEVRRQGIEMMEDFPVQEINGRAGSFVLTGPQKIRARSIIGADGVGSLVRKTLVDGGIPKGLSHLVQAEIPADGDLPDSLRFDFTPLKDGIPGYAWLFPELDADGKPVLKVGVYDRRGRSSRPLRDYCVETAARWGYRIATKSVMHWSFREYSPENPISAPGVLLAGDAAGSDPVVAEGIRQALMWGELAGNHVAESLSRGNDILSGYEIAFDRSELGVELRRNLFFANILYSRFYPFALGLGFRNPRVLRKVFEWVAGQSDYEGLTAMETARKIAKSILKKAVGID